MKKYFLTLDEFSFEEYEVWKLLCRYSKYDTNIAGYTVNQIVVASDKRAELTTQKVRTVLKKFEKSGYIGKTIPGTKGKESTVKLTLKDMLFEKEQLTTIQQLSNNNATNKDEQLQHIEGIDNNNLTTIQQLTNNTTKKKEKEKEKEYIYKDLSFLDLYHVKVTEDQYLKLVEVSKNDSELVHDKMLYLESGIVEGNKKYVAYSNHYLTLRKWINSQNKKVSAPTDTKVNKKANYNNSICNNRINNTPKIEHTPFI